MKQSKEKRAEVARLWQEANRDKTRAACQRHYGANKGHFRLQDLYKCYSLTKEKYWKLLGEQNGLCKICKRINDGKALFVDHKHVEGETFGFWLCDYLAKFLETAQIVE